MSSIGVFIGLTVVLFGGAAFLMGQAIGETWRPMGQCVAYGLLLGGADRFFHNALFAEDMLSLVGYLVDSGVLVAIALTAFRLTRARRIVSQYPWLYERSGLFSWRAKG
jgi:hypothetical protein